MVSRFAGSSIHVTESGIHNDGIRNPDLIWNPESKEFRIRNPEGRNPESRGSESVIRGIGMRMTRIRNTVGRDAKSAIQNFCGFCYMDRGFV